MHVKIIAIEEQTYTFATLFKCCKLNLFQKQVFHKFALKQHFHKENLNLIRILSLKQNDCEIYFILLENLDLERNLK